MRIFRYFFILVLFPFSVHALTPMDFNKGFPLWTDPHSPLQRFEVSYEIYEAGFRKDLGDMRIFNGNNHAMPMHLGTIFRSTVDEKQEMKTTKLLLPVFSLETSDSQGRRIDDYRMMVNTSDNGTVVSVERTGEKPLPKNRTILVDATFGEGFLNSLSFELKTPMASLLGITIQGSDDLSNWQFAGAGTLARMEHENGQILKNHIEITGKNWKYYRIQGEGDLSALGEIHGVFGSALSPQKALLRWHTLQGEEVEENVFEYRLPKGLPVSLMDLAHEGNAVFGVTLLLPAGENSWREAAKYSLYRLNMDGKQIRNDPVLLSLPMERFRLAIKGAPVAIRVGWRPQEIIFMPQDTPPYLLAVGNPKIVKEDLLAPMLGNPADLKIGEATLGNAQILGGEKVLEPEKIPPEKTDYQTYILWGILGLGVLLLAWMAWSLVRGAKNSGAKE